MNTRKKPLISVVVNTLNEERNLPRCLESIRLFADEIVVIDMFSKDKTVEVAKSFGAKVFFHKPVGYVEPARNFAIGKATGTWIFLIDADEKITKSLAKKLRFIAENKKELDCILIPRKNIILGKWMQNSRWWPDYLPRFFKRGKIIWPEQIHQQPNLGGKNLHTLPDNERLALIHYNYESLDQFLLRGKKYAEIQAKELVGGKGYQLSGKDLLTKPLSEFLGRFFAGEAYKDGFHGLALSLLQAWVVLLTYLKVWETKKYEQKLFDSVKVKGMLKEVIYELDYWRDDFIVKKTKSPLLPIIKILLKIRNSLLKL